MLTQDHDAIDTQTHHVKRQRLSKQKRATIAMSPSRPLPASAPFSLLAPASVASTPSQALPASNSKSQRAKASLRLTSTSRPPSSRALSQKWGAIDPLSTSDHMPSASPFKRPRKAMMESLSNQLVPIADAPVSPDEQGQSRPVNHNDAANLVAVIRETHRRRQDFHRAEKSLTLQIKAIGRRLAGHSLSPTAVVPSDSNGADPTICDFHVGSVSADLSRSEGLHEDDYQPGFADVALSSEEDDEVHVDGDIHNSPDNLVSFATLPLVAARATIKKHRLLVERELTKLAIQLPVFESFTKPINGMGALGLAQIVGEAGDLANYSNPAKLWKRMGLAVINGKSQRRVAGSGAIEQGYSPVRRAIMFCIGDSLLKKQNAYRELYLVRKETEQAKVPDGTKMLWHRRAQRYAEKRLLRNLWRAWRDQRAADDHSIRVSPAPSA